MIDESLHESPAASSASVHAMRLAEAAEGRGNGVSHRLIATFDEAVRSVLHPRSVVARRLHEKARACRMLDAPLYTVLLESAARDVLAGGVCWTVLKGHERDPRGSALALRFMGSIHRLVLQGRAPELAPFCPSVGGSQSPEQAVAPFLRVVERRAGELRQMLQHSVQTNEVGRCGALLGGFLLVARETGLPLRLLEVGASAGLNLRWDHYRYRGASASWGSTDSSVVLDWDLAAGTPDTDVWPTVAERRGCDLAPIDPGDAEARWRLMSHVMPSHVARLRVLEQALEHAARLPVQVDRATASTWLASQLREPVPGVATIVFHTIVMQFMTRRERQSVQRAITSAGARASTRAPLAWLRMEGSKPLKDVLLTTWPDGRERRIASAGLYGRPVLWLAGNEATV